MKMAARACSMCQVVPSLPHTSKVCRSCKTVWNTIWWAMAKRNMNSHYKALKTRFPDEAKTRFPDEAKLLWDNFTLASTIRPQFDFMAWIVAKAPGVLRHLAQLDALAEQEQQCHTASAQGAIHRCLFLQRCCPSTTIRPR